MAKRTDALQAKVDMNRKHPKFSVSSSLEDYGIHKFYTWGSAVSFLETKLDHAYQDMAYREFQQNGRSAKMFQLEQERKQISSSISSMRVYKGDVYVIVDGIGYWTRLL